MTTKALRRKSIASRAFALLLCLALAVPLPLQAVSAADPGGMGRSTAGGAAPAGGGAPVLLVTGQDVIAGGTYTAANVSCERSYTLDELKALSGPGPSFYSAVNSSGTKRVYIGEGVDVAFLLSLSGYEADSGGDLAFVASDGYLASFNVDVPLNRGRKYYPNIGAAAGEADYPADAAAVLAWETGYVTAPGIPALNTPEDPLRLLVGQTDITNQNNGLFNQKVKTVQAGAAISERPITVSGKAYTRAEILMMPRVAAEYTYSSSGGDRTDRVRGVLLAQLLEDTASSTALEFHAADGYAVDATGMTKSDLVNKNAVLAYEMWNDEAKTWEGIYNTAKSGPEFGYFRLYLDGERPAQMIDSISEKPVSKSAYKHVSYDGPPYKLDAITSATLTVEGPGVAASTPISVQQLEETADGNIYKGVYSDSRGSGSVAFSYEGVKLLSILDGLVNSAVQTLDFNVEVVFKNRWRQETGRISYSDMASAKTPLIMAYGTAGADEAAIPPAPFVFSMGAGENSALGNGDGPLKLVYDQSEFPGLAAKSPKFSSVAYLYIEEGTPPPGFKHTEATDDAYSNKANTEYLVTLTGGALGREVSYTVSELEAMVEYENGKPKADGKGYRDEYGLSNTTYWYVNEYEGVKVWDLLTGIGVDAEEFKDDDSTLVSFSAWDNYQISAAFSMKQLAHPELFCFYEKSPLDIGTDRPTKEQLATAEYQPGNQGDGWTVDGNGYPVKKGYPVLLAYGLNGYPYVRDANLPGYKSGLGNSGGPMRVIYGKTDGLNRSDPDAIENYAYFFNNGSQQLQRVQEVYVGDSTRYSTHLENPAAAYQGMKNTQALTVEIVSGGITVPYTFTLAELESILYGPGVSKRDRDNEHRQEKGYYFYKVAGNGSPVEDLFEGVSLEYLLAEHIGMQGSLGSVELYSGSSAEPSATYNLAEIGGKGQNSMRNTGGLGMMVAFAKNGYPLVSGSGSAGYVGDDTATGKTVKNSGGPLQFVRAQTAVEYEAGTIDNSDAEKTSVENLTKIVVRLDADTYAHVGADYADYASQGIMFTGAVAIEGGVSKTVGALETMQKYMVTDSYTVGSENQIYRGLDLYRLLRDKDIGASALMNEVTVSNADGQSKTVTVDDLTAGGKKIILAYGIAVQGDPSDAKPLVPDSGSPGYDAAYKNSGGPVRLVIDGGAGVDCISNVSEIEISAATLDSWKHNSGNFTQYAGNTLEISGQNLAYNKTFTVAELEAMDNIIVSDSYQMGSPTWIQGVELYKLLQNIGFSGDLDSSAFTANSVDNYPISFNATDLKNGVNGKPILIAFGQGNSSSNGLPLVPDITSPGFDPNVGNSYGPLRLVVNDNTGWCVKYLNRIVVGAAGGNPEPADELDFNIYGLPGGTVSYDIRAIKNLQGNIGKEIASYTYSSGGLVTDTARGVYLYDLLKANGVSESAAVTVNTTDGYEASQADYRDIPMSEIKAQKYFVAYDVGPDADNLVAVSDADKQNPPVAATVRIYRNFNDGSNWRNRLTNIKGVTVTGYGFDLYPGGVNDMPQASVRAVACDASGGIWIGTNGAGMAYISPDGDITRYSTLSTPALKTDFVTGISIASDGSVWFTQGGSVGSQTAPPSAHFGFARYKDGGFTYYDSNTEGSALISDCVYGIDTDAYGNVWVAAQHTLLSGGMEGGLTKFNTAANTWQTWTMKDGLPTVSAWAVKADGAGGAWVTTYRTSNLVLDWPDESYAHVSAGGVVTPYAIPAGDDFTWSRSVAMDPDGGAYITRMSGAHDPENDGGWLDYIPPGGDIRSYKGDDLIPDLKAKGWQGFYPEIRTVFVDASGGLWLSTNGLGVYRCSVSDGAISITDHYSSEQGSWPAGPFDDVWSISVSADGMAFFGSNGGLACTKVELAPPTPAVTVLDPPFTIKQGGKADIAWVIGGSGNSIKNLPSDAGKTEKVYRYDGAERKVRGALLSTVLAASGISGANVLVTLNTTDGFQRDNYKNIPLVEIAGQEYFVAYDLYNPETESWDKIADVDSNSVQASLRIYRNLDAGASGNRNNEVKGLSGITITTVPDPGYVGDATEATAELKITGAVEKPGYFTVNGLKTYPGVVAQTKGYNWKNSSGTTDKDTMTGVYLEALLEDIMKLVDGAKSVTVKASDGFALDFNLDANEHGVYWTDIDGNKMMLAWRGTNSRTDRNIVDFGLPRLIVGQADADDVNRTMWVSDVISITVNGKEPHVPEHVGDATVDTAQLKITGEVDKPGYFSVTGLKSYTEYIDTVTYPWYTNSGPGAPRTFTGIYLEDLLKGVMTLNTNAASITLYASDYDPANSNTFATLMLNYVKEEGQAPGAYSADYEGRRVMLAWDQNGSAISSGLRLVIGQNDATHVNSAFAVQGIVSIIVNPETVTPPEPEITVLDPPFTIKQSGKADIAWVIGGSGNSIKNLPSDAGKTEKVYRYDGAERKVRGALLSTVLAASGISGANVLVTLNTTDGFQCDNYKNIPLVEIAGQEYFVAYDLYNTEAESWDKIADVDSNSVQASLRIYRNLDAGTSGNRNNEVKGLSGITVTSSSTDPGTNPGASYVSVGGATPENYDFKIVGSVEKPVYFTIEGLKNRYSGQTKDYYWLNSAGSTGTDTFTGVYLESLLKDAEIVKLKNAASINVAASDGFSGNFNLDASSFGVYGTAIDGNKMMLAWRGTNSRTDRNIVDFDLPRLAIGQKEAGHINRSSWITDIVTITVNSSPTSNPGAKGNYAQTIENQETPLALIMEMSTTIKADTVVQDGVANATNTKESVGTALNGLKTKADGNTATTQLLRIDATTEDDAYKTVYTLPADALHLITSDGKTNIELVASQGSIKLSAEQLKLLDKGGKDPLVIEMENTDVQPGDLAAVNIAVRMGNTAVIDFGDVLLMVGMPFSLDDSMQVESIVAYNLAENGEKSLIKLAAYDAGTKSMKLGISHLGEYSIGYNPVTFADIKKHWGKSSIEFLAARDIVNGRSADAFDPEGKVTRAEFVKMLAESVDGIDVAGAANAQFSDVLGSAWYAAYVNWAASLGIVQGNPDGTFQPNGLITREQMATMAERFMQAMKFDLAAVQNPAGFTDQDQIASYAKAAISHMQQYGIMNGNPDGSFNPKGTATRAESAKVIKVYIEGVLS